MIWLRAEGHLLKMDHITVIMREVIKPIITISSVNTDKSNALLSDIMLHLPSNTNQSKLFLKKHILDTSILIKIKLSVPKLPSSKSEVGQVHIHFSKLVS